MEEHGYEISKDSSIVMKNKFCLHEMITTLCPICGRRAMKFPEMSFDKRVILASNIPTDIDFVLKTEAKGIFLIPRYQHTTIILTNGEVVEPKIIRYDSGEVLHFEGYAEYYVKDVIKTLREVIIENHRPFSIDVGRGRDISPEWCKVLLFWLWSIGYRK